MKDLLCSALIYCRLLNMGLVLAYSRVSKNGEARAIGPQDVAFTVPSVYIVTPRTVDLRPGEAVDHPPTPKYSTLDKEMAAELDAPSSIRGRAQERFHPPASFEHALSHSNSQRQQQQISAGADSAPLGSSTGDNVIYARPIVSMTYDYSPAGSYGQRLKPGPKPATLPSSSFTIYSPEKFPDSFTNEPSNDSPPGQQSPPFDFDDPPKSAEITNHYDHPYSDPSTFSQDPYPHEVLYDHIPDDNFDHHHHHHRHRPAVSTEEPATMDQRVIKRPYSYYYIGKKLWYIPLYFSIYFIVYIAALVVKSIARHKITFPPSPEPVARSANGWTDYAVEVVKAIEKYGGRAVAGR